MAEDDFELSAEAIHEFDQGYAASKELFSAVMAYYRQTRAEHEQRCLPHAVTVVAVATTLMDELDALHMVSALTYAAVSAVHADDGD